MGGKKNRQSAAPAAAAAAPVAAATPTQSISSILSGTRRRPGSRAGTNLTGGGTFGDLASGRRSILGSPVTA